MDGLASGVYVVKWQNIPMCHYFNELLASLFGVPARSHVKNHDMTSVQRNLIAGAFHGYIGI